MEVGQVVADRFEIRRVAGVGGMSIVYLALDRLSQTQVAVKVLKSRSTDTGSGRFAREARLLAELRHPAVVRYVAHGDTVTGEAYLAMEWLEGEDLARRLRRGRLGVAESVTLIRRVAEGLAFAHDRGVLHRDIKPGNLFLAGGRIESVKILDFGIARLRASSLELTRQGGVVGTPVYMSPEQAAGREVDARTDVWALGCVLYCCLTGKRPFHPERLAGAGESTSPVTPRASVHRPEVSAELDVVIGKMLAHELDRRYQNASEVAAALAAIDSVFDQTATRGRTLTSITDRERRLHSVIMACGVPEDADTEKLEEIVRGFGGTVQRHSESSVLVTMPATNAATDLASRAARCAMAMASLLEDAKLAITTGADIIDESSSESTVIDRAAAFLRGEETDETRTSGRARVGLREETRLERPSSLKRSPVEQGNAPEIYLDDNTAGLLARQFEVAEVPGGYMLRGEQARDARRRTVLGKATEFVAREAELAALEAVFDTCIDEPTSRAVLITAPAGIGKSRLREEFIGRLEDGGASFQVLIGRADPLSAGAPFRLLSGAIRNAAGILDGEALSAQQEKLVERIAVRLDGDDVDRVVEFIGEMVGVPFSDWASVQLRAARQDARLMRDQMGRAWERWLRAELGATPTVLVLEDLHWGDLPTVEIIDNVLRNLADAPLMVLALARPEVEDLFPRLWAERGVHQIRLGALTKRAGRRLVRQVLGDTVGEDTVQHIVDRAGGNAFCLEELIRVAAEGRFEQMPETVLAVVQARLERMESRARRVLRAASILGRRFWRGGVEAMLGGEETSADIADWLEVLVDREVIARHSDSKFSGETEYMFRHDLTRDAAYAMLTDADLAAGHALAAEWLEAVGESEAVVLAEHFERGGQPGRAGPWYRRAAEQAMAGNDFAAALSRAERGILCNTTGETLGALHLLQTEALIWQGEFETAARASIDALRHLPTHDDDWYAAVAEAATAHGVVGDRTQLRELARMLGDADRGSPDAYALAATRLAEHLIILGDVDKADELLASLDRRMGDFGGQSPQVAAQVLSARGMRACFGGNVGANLEYVEQAAEHFEAAGDLRNACTKRERAGYTMMDLGAYPEAERMLREALATAESLQLQNVAATARHNLGLTLGRLGKRTEAWRVEQAAALAFRASGNRRMEGAAREYLALILLSDDPIAAETEAREALRLAEQPTLLPLNRAESLAILARALLAQDRPEAAFAAAAESMQMLEELGGIDDGEALIRLTFAEGLKAAGRDDEAEQAIAAARERLEARAERIANPEHRASFLVCVPENARTIELAAAWLNQ